MIGKNNPFNIRTSKKNFWYGQTGQTRGFCDFLDVAFSVRVVMFLFLKTYRRYQCFTIEDCINRFCPFGDGDNNPDIYLSFISYDTHLDINTPVANLDLSDWFKLLTSMCYMESEYKLSYESFIKGFNLFREHEK